MNNDVIVGIDLGTTNSAIAYINDYGRPEVLSNSEGKKITPSVVQLRANGNALVGDAAKQEIALEKENTAQFFKRDMGTAAVYSYYGHNYTPTELSAEVLKKLKADGEAQLGKPIRRAVITVPAYFQDAPRLATRDAGEMAGLEVIQMINEPTAAAIAYGLKQNTQDELVMVYDLGGGTFDISLARVSPDGVEVIGTDGNHNLGGKDWDDRLVQYLCEQFDQHHGINPLDDTYTFQEILIRAEEAKKSLSARASVMVPINCQGRMDRIEVTRELFENLTGDLLSQTEMLIGKVLEETNYDYSRIQSVLMVGGSTRMPACFALVKRLTGKMANAAVNPDECVAVGAASQASEYGEDKQPRGGLAFIGRDRIRDVMSHSMGMIAVSADGERYINSILIPKNRPIPCSEIRPYQVRTRETGDNTTSVFVTQGEGDDPANSSFVGKYVIGDITHGKKGLAVLDIAYEYDRSGVVSVKATQKSTGRDLSVIKQTIPEDMSWIYKSPKEVSIAHKAVYLSVDLSGSMTGAPLAEAKQAMHEFVRSSDLSHTSIGLISFADSVRMDQPATQDGKKLSRAIDALAVGLGGGNSAHPFGHALEQLKTIDGSRYFVVLTDGAWSCQSSAIQQAKVCHQAGIEIIAIGFGSADEKFLREIATSDQSALLIKTGDLTSTFGNIAQELVRSEPGGDAGLLMRWRR
jgi:molecular chaperone DnaK